MSDINKAILIGRVTGAIELKKTPSGASVATFSIASNRTIMQDGAKKEIVSFFNCVSFGKTAETIEKYVKKGQRIGIEGRLQQRSWEKDGQKRSTVEVVVDNFQFLSSADSKKGVESMGAPVDSVDDNPFDDKNIPF